MEDVQQQIFIHNGLEYKLEWAESRFYQPQIAHKFGSKLLQYIHFTKSPDFPESLFNRKNGLRCSSFRIKHLITHGQKKLSIDLLRKGYVSLVSPENSSDYPIQSVSKLPQMAKIWFDIHTQLSDTNPGHEPILKKILELNENALATEVPIWTVTLNALQKRKIPSSPYNCLADRIFTGHIDLLMYDENDGSLIVADYKPEEQFLRSLPQVAIYGLIMKQVLNHKKVKCVSFSRERAWVYDPEIIRTTIVDQLRMYGNPSLEWIDLVYSI